MADAVADPVALLIVPCPDCGRNVVTYVARHCQNGVERFYKCRSHIPARGGCDFYRCPQAYTESLAAAATPMSKLRAANVHKASRVTAYTAAKASPIFMKRMMKE
ncbi:hypothetical protein VPH35_077088 [Triticum aestivum]